VSGYVAGKHEGIDGRAWLRRDQDDRWSGQPLSSVREDVVIVMAFPDPVRRQNYDGNQHNGDADHRALSGRSRGLRRGLVIVLRPRRLAWCTTLLAVARLLAPARLLPETVLVRFVRHTSTPLYS